MTTHNTHILGKYFTSIIIAALFFTSTFCQDTVNQYRLMIQYVDKDTSFNPDVLHLQTSFTNQPSCIDYVNKLVPKLNMLGYTAASIDEMLIDSASMHINLYVGEKQNWIRLKTDSIEKKAIDESGFIEKNFNNAQVNFAEIQQIKERVLNYYEKNLLFVILYLI